MIAERSYVWLHGYLCFDTPSMAAGTFRVLPFDCFFDMTYWFCQKVLPTDYYWAVPPLRSPVTTAVYATTVVLLHGRGLAATDRHHDDNLTPLRMPGRKAAKRLRFGGSPFEAAARLAVRTFSPRIPPLSSGALSRSADDVFVVSAVCGTANSSPGHRPDGLISARLHSHLTHGFDTRKARAFAPSREKPSLRRQFHDAQSDGRCSASTWDNAFTPQNER